jgi:G3E family GTPase
MVSQQSIIINFTERLHIVPCWSPHEGIHRFFVADRGFWTVARQDQRVVGKRKQLLMNSLAELFKAAVGKICAANTPAKKHIAAEDDMDNRHEVHHHHDDDGAEGDQEHEHGHDEFESFALTLPEITDANAFVEKLAQVIRTHDILRLKGFATVQGKPMRLVIQAVGPRIDTYFDRPFGREPRATRLVVIGEAGLDQSVIGAAITAALAT